MAVAAGKSNRRKTRSMGKAKRAVVKHAADRKSGGPRKTSTAGAAGRGADAVLTAQLEAISGELSAIVDLRSEVEELRISIEALSDRIDALAESLHADKQERPDHNASSSMPGERTEAEALESADA
jgi:hypothetical protein